jgi:hypothetical protein
MLVGIIGMTKVRKILAIIRGKDRRGRMMLLQIKTVKGLRREKNPTLVTWYLPVIDHLKHMFSNPRDV